MSPRKTDDRFNAPSSASEHRSSDLFVKPAQSLGEGRPGTGPGLHHFTSESAALKVLLGRMTALTFSSTSL